ncbi:MAG: hypothetical protein R2746_01225 [Acidimicrobiales bacterium]
MSHAQMLESAAWAAADGTATAEQLALLEADPRSWRWALEDLLEEAEDNLESVRRLNGPERAQVVADFEAELARLEAAYDLLTKVGDSSSAVAAIAAADPAGEVRLQASWHGGNVVVWAAGPGTAPATADELSIAWRPSAARRWAGASTPRCSCPPGGQTRRCRYRCRNPSAGWWRWAPGWEKRGRGRQRGVARPGGRGRRAPGGPKTPWCPPFPESKRPDGRSLDLAVRWVPALVDEALLEQLTAAMPGPVTVLTPGRAD